MEGRIAKPQSSCRVPSPCIPAPCPPTPCRLVLLTLHSISLHCTALLFTLLFPAHPTPLSSNLLTPHPTHFHLASLNPASFHHSFVWGSLFNSSSFLPTSPYRASPCLALPRPAHPVHVVTHCLLFGFCFHFIIPGSSLVFFSVAIAAHLLTLKIPRLVLSHPFSLFSILLLYCTSNAYFYLLPLIFPLPLSLAF